MRLHHVQLAIPRAGEAVARRFYGDGLGMTEVAKPADLQGRGGVWFRTSSADGVVTAELHLGVEDPFRPARKAHPGLVLDSVADLEMTAERLVSLGFAVSWSDRYTFPAHERFHANDGHGNRVEVLAPAVDGSTS